RARLNIALEAEEDPLAFYEELINWTLANYPPKSIPHSGLVELLEEAGRQFKGDQMYQGDKRYLKIWLTYAQYVDCEQEEPPAQIYKYLLQNDIGTMSAQLYEDYAASLERFDRRQDADMVYRHGIQKRARPIERLKKRYAEFRSRSSNPKSLSTPSSCPVPSSSWKDAPTAVQILRQHPFNNYPHVTKKVTSVNTPTITTSTLAAPTSVATDAVASSFQKHGHDRYAVMLMPSSGTNRRPEKLCFHLSMLFTEDGTEYSVHEVRARSMGLLGKKWPPPSNASTASSADQYRGTGQRAAASSKKVYYEPTVTIATKEALADVFGMYNSPEKTLRFGAPAGSKHAPVRKVEPMVSLKAVTPGKPDRSSGDAKTPGPQSQIFHDAPKTLSNENALNTSRNRRGLSTKDPLAPAVKNVTSVASNIMDSPKDSLQLREKEPNISLPVFTPVASKESRPSARSQNGGLPGRASPVTTAKFTPFLDSDAQQSKPAVQFSNIFSLPPKNENVLTAAQPLAQKPLFTPFVDNKSSAPLARPVLGERSRSITPLQAHSTPSTSTDEDGDQIFAGVAHVQDQDYYDECESTDESAFDEPPPQLETHTPVHSDMGEEDDFEDEDEMDEYPPPMGGRLGKFNVMTPITERTFEYTHTTATSARATPSDPHGSRVFTHDHIVAKESAEQLAAELANDDGFSDIAEEDLGQVEERTGTLSLSDALAAASSFKPPNPCNPFEAPIASSLLSFIPPDLGFQDLRAQESNQLDGLQKFSRKKARRGSGNTSRDSMQGSVAVFLNGRQYDVVDKLGEGGFGAVFEAIDVIAANAKLGELDEEDGYDLVDEDEIPKVALKVVKPRNLWEFHVLRRLHLNLPPRLKCSVIVPEALYAYRDESFLVLELLKQGTLLDVVNNAPAGGVTQQGACLDELLVVFFTIELLRLLEGMHKAGFIHGDMKIDNCLLRLEEVPGGASAWTGVYQPSGEGGWGCKGIKMIDFGRTIDTNMFPHGQRFTGDWDPDPRDCLEMREGRPWTYQTDYFGLAGIIYCMLYGKYIESSSITAIPNNTDEPTRYKLSAPFKRYWQGDLWTRLFDMLLNSALVHPDGKLPLCEEIGQIREEMESWLQANSNRGSNSLKGLLKKVDL
ncbi:Mad3/BUB1 homology region 1-domain-containing protein, partial [Cytidiella melzeri]